MHLVGCTPRIRCSNISAMVRPHFTHTNKCYSAKNGTHTQPVLVDTCSAPNVRGVTAWTMNAGECNCIKIHVPSPTEHNASLLGKTNWSIPNGERNARLTQTYCVSKERKTEIQAFFTTDFILLLGTFLLFLLWWHYSPMLTLVSLMDFSQSSLFFFDLSIQFSIPHLLIPVCTQFHHLFFGRPLSRLSWGLLLNTWLTSPLHSILLTWPIQFNRLTLTNESLSKSPNSCNYFSLHRFLQILFTLIPPQKKKTATSCLAIPLDTRSTLLHEHTEHCNPVSCYWRSKFQPQPGDQTHCTSSWRRLKPSKQNSATSLSRLPIQCSTAAAATAVVVSSHVIRYRKTSLYRVIRNDCRGFNNLSYTIHLR